MDEAFARFTAWLKANGASLDKLSFGKDEEGVWGVYATQDIQQDEVMCTIPFRLSISEKQYQGMLPSTLDVGYRALMSAYIVLELLKGEMSFYYPYLSVIPDKITTALSCTEEELSFLEGTNLKAAADERRRMLKADFDSLLPHIPSDLREKFSWEKFLWSYCAIASRSFPYKLVDPSTDRVAEVMFPISDSMNHKPLTRITWKSRTDILEFDIGGKRTDLGGGVLELITGEPINAGVEVYNNYGPKSNEELLTGYGFCLKDNPFDYVVVKANFTYDHLHEKKTQILQGRESLELKHFITREDIPQGLLRLVRVTCMNKREADLYLKDSTRDRQLSFVGFRNELVVVLTLADLLAAKLKVIKETDRLHSVPNLTKWQRYCDIYRQGQMEILLKAIEHVNMMQRCLVHALKSHELTRQPIPPSFNPYKHLDNTHISDSSDLSSLVLTVKSGLAEDPEFSEALEQVFEDLKEEEDTLLILILIRIRGRPTSHYNAWIPLLAPHINLQPESAHEQYERNEETEELHEMFNGLFPALSDAFPDIFPPSQYTFPAFHWADQVLQSHSCEFLDDEGYQTVCIIPQ